MTVVATTYIVEPHHGAGPVLLGMRRAQVRTAMPGDPSVLQKSDHGPPADSWHDNAFQVFYDRNDAVEFIELSRGPVIAIVRGISVFARPAETVVQELRLESALDHGVEDPEYSFVFPGLELAFWRQVLPEQELDDGTFFDTVGIGVRGYFSAPGH